MDLEIHEDLEVRNFPNVHADLGVLEVLQSLGVCKELPHESPGQLSGAIQGAWGLTPEQVHGGKEIVYSVLHVQV